MASASDNNSPLKRMKESILANDLPEIERTLSEFGDRLDSVIEENAFTALHLSVKQNLVDAARLLLERGATADLKTQYGDTCLHLAVKTGNIELVRLFLGRVRVNELNHITYTPLHEAVINRQPRIVELLLDNGADVNAQDLSGTTPLHKAIQAVDVELIRLLLRRGANPNLRDKNGNVPFLQSFQLRNDALVQEFLDRGADVKARNNERRNALHVAVIYCDCARISKLLDLGLSVDERSESSKTPLHLALKYRHEHASSDRPLDVVRLLVSCGADVNLTDHSGNTPLDYAVSYQEHDEAIVRYLVFSGAKLGVHVKFLQNRVPMREAIESGDADTVRSLLMRLNDVTSLGVKDKNHLAMAVKTGDEAVIEFLLRNGEDVRDEVAWAEIASLRANWAGVLKLFEAHGEVYWPMSAKGHLLLHEAVRRDNAQLVRHLLDRCGDVNGSHQDKLPLEVASQEAVAGKPAPATWILIKHIAKLSVRNWFVDERNMRLATRMKEFHECCDELGLMNETRLCEDRQVTYFDLITKHPNTFAKVLNLRLVNQVFKAGEYKSLFAHYGDEIERDLSKLVRVMKISRFEDVVGVLLGKVFESHVIRRICSYYNDRDFECCIAEYL